jgi:cytochrome b561
MRLGDTQNGYGWISIVLHWTTAAVILVMWFIGDSIAVAESVNQDNLILLHTSIAILAYALLWLRVLWRVCKGHPGPLLRQRGVFYRIGVGVHLIMVAAIAALLVSGPLMAWSGDIPIRVFDWFSIPAPFGMNARFFSAAHAVHVGAATVLIIGAALHIGGVFKHVAFNRDGTFAKMLLAADNPARLRQNDQQKSPATSAEIRREADAASCSMARRSAIPKAHS